MRRNLTGLTVMLIVLASSLAWTEMPVQPRDYPLYVSPLANLNDATLFANGGWDGNWYVGFDTCWIKRLPPVPPGNYSHAYLGAKLGRAKLSINPKNIWDKHVIPGSVYIAISSTAAWSRDQQFDLTDTANIPLEGDYYSAAEGSGESEWFWVEIPLERINFSGDNYVAVGASTPGLLQVSSSPVLAAGMGGKGQDTWLLRDVQGAPPRSPRDLGHPIGYFEPAMALKLIPQGIAHPIQIQITGWDNTATPPAKPVITVQAAGDSLQEVWLEYSSGKTWTRIGRKLLKAPYIFSLDQTKLPHGRLELRASAKNIWEEQASSRPFTIDVSVPK